MLQCNLLRPIITKLLSLKIYINLWKLIYNKHIHHLVNPNKINVIDKCNHVEKLMSHTTVKWYKVSIISDHFSFYNHRPAAWNPSCHIYHGSPNAESDTEAENALFFIGIC